MEIVLLRHGKPEIELKGHLNGTEIKQLVADYLQSGIKDSPHKSLKNRFNHYFIVCSDLTRSVQTAKKLDVDYIHLSDNLFAEIELPHFDQSKIRMPVTAWLILLRIMWLFGFKKNGESFSKAKVRAKEATNKLITLARENEKVILVGHGLMNRLIANQLRRHKWQGPISPGKNHWQYGRYTST